MVGNIFHSLPCQHWKKGAEWEPETYNWAIRTFDTLNHLFQYNEMIIPGSTYWNVGIGRDPGEVKDDEEGIRTMKTLGKNMAWLLKKVHD